jgi:subtilisin family serine protease
MKPLLGFFTCIVLGLTSHSKTLVVAVLDTGFIVSEETKNAKLCRFGHKDFTIVQAYSKHPKTADPIPVDNHRHGTNIAGLIQKFAGNANFCIVIVKYFDPLDKSESGIQPTIDAINYARIIKADYINYSGGGLKRDTQELIAVRRYLDQGGTFVAAAGNEKSDLRLNPYYPAMYDSKIVSVGSWSSKGNIASYSNFGFDVKRWEIGSDREAFGIKMSGTSQAAAIVTGKLLKERK